jgi:hypothetical protein
MIQGASSKVKIKVLSKIGGGANPVIFWMSLLAGLGFILMMIALGVGVIQTNADTRGIGLLFISGTALFILGLVGWFASARPDQHFDDINVPQYTGHHEEHHDEAAH